MKNVELTIEGTILTIKVDLSKDFGPSSSGKTTIIASTEGNVSVLNGFGAGFILVSLAKDFNFSAFAIESAWLAISIWGVVPYFSRMKNTKLKESNHGC